MAGNPVDVKVLSDSFEYMESFMIEFEFDAWSSCTLELWLEFDWVLLIFSVSGKLKFVLVGGKVEGDGNNTEN